MLVEVLSDNRNRTAAELRLVSKTVATSARAAVLAFHHHRSEVTLIASGAGGVDENALLEDLLELEADGYELTAEGALVYGPFTTGNPARRPAQSGLERASGATSGIRSTASTCNRATWRASASAAGRP